MQTINIASKTIPKKIAEMQELCFYFLIMKYLFLSAFSGMQTINVASTTIPKKIAEMQE